MLNKLGKGEWVNTCNNLLSLDHFFFAYAVQPRAFIRGNLLLNLLNSMTNLILFLMNQQIWIRFSNQQSSIEYPVKYSSNQDVKCRNESWNTYKKNTTQECSLNLRIAHIESITLTCFEQYKCSSAWKD